MIPDLNEIDKFMTLVSEYGVAFEYNDFFDPAVYEDERETERRIEAYLKLDRDRSRDTLHGVFYDMAPLSQDRVIREHSRKLMRQSMDIAGRLGCKGVVFHTGLLAGLNTAGYISGWVNGMSAFLSELATDYADIEIYMENTFETYPSIFNALMDRLKEHKNIGLCLDYAHASLTDTPTDTWMEELAPRIRHMHLNDNDLISDLHLAAGDGNIDYIKYKSLMEKYGLCSDDTDSANDGECHTGMQILLEVNGIEKAKRSLEFMTGL